LRVWQVVQYRPLGGLLQLLSGSVGARPAGDKRIAQHIPLLFPDSGFWMKRKTMTGSNFPEPRFIDSNNIRMALYEQGDGPVVILLHGFPELAYSWRHQLPALARAGYRAIAPDQRGYGRTDSPPHVRDYRIAELMDDIEGLLESLDLKSATFIGHDWGALLLWHMSLVRPQLIDRQVILNIPFQARPAVDPVQLMRERLGEDFYIVNFQGSDAADKAFAADPKHFFDMMMRKNQITRAQYEKLPQRKKVLSLLAIMAREKSSGDALLSDEERDYYAAAYAASGFSGPINWYRNMSDNWACLEDVEQSVRVPTLFIGAMDDVIISPDYIESMRRHVTDLDVHVLDRCGHWSQQEKPGEVNALILAWLAQRMALPQGDPG